MTTGICCQGAELKKTGGNRHGSPVGSGVFAAPGAFFEITEIKPGKIFSPNNDNWNDRFMIYFDNPNDDNIMGRIYSLRGDAISDMKTDATGNCIYWDGKDYDGRPLPGGIYIYQMEVTGTESKIINGTCIIVK